MRIMTSNIWGNFFNNPPELRKDALLRVYKKYNPDIIGFQEAAQGWYDVDLFWKLGEEYTLIGTACCNNKNSTPIAVKRSITVIAYGHEQLEKTPDVSKAITWAVVEKDEQRVAVCNTHFWWMRGGEPEETKKACGVSGYTLEDHCKLRSDNARQLVRLMKYLSERFSAPVFAFGDMNCVISEGVFDVYAENDVKMLFDAAAERDVVCSIHGDPKRGDDGLFHGKRADAEYIAHVREVLRLPKVSGDEEGYHSSIDHIVGRGDGFDVLQYRVVEDEDALNASDHSPVWADIRFR